MLQHQIKRLHCVHFGSKHQGGSSSNWVGMRGIWIGAVHKKQFSNSKQRLLCVSFRTGPYYGVHRKFE